MFKRRPHAFTIVELLIVISIIALLAALLAPALGKARQNAKQLNELTGARGSIQAYVGQALSRDGVLLDGYASPAASVGPSGNPIFGEPAKRYPWRLVEHIDQGIAGTILVNEQAAALGVRPEGFSEWGWWYSVSVSPSFGLNYQNVGGRGENPLFNMPGTIFNTDEAVSPSRLLIFASARQNTLTPGVYSSGFFRITAPNDRVYPWASAAAYTYEGGAELTGNVDPRWNGYAVAANLDGSAGMYDLDTLRDMTRWNNRAAELGDPDFTP